MPPLAQFPYVTPVDLNALVENQIDWLASPHPQSNRLQGQLKRPRYWALRAQLRAGQLDAAAVFNQP